MNQLATPISIIPSPLPFQLQSKGALYRGTYIRMRDPSSFFYHAVLPESNLAICRCMYDSLRVNNTARTEGNRSSNIAILRYERSRMGCNVSEGSAGLRQTLFSGYLRSRGYYLSCHCWILLMIDMEVDSFGTKRHTPLNYTASRLTAHVLLSSTLSLALLHLLHISFVYTSRMSFNDLERGQSSQPLLRGGGQGMLSPYHRASTPDLASFTPNPTIHASRTLHPQTKTRHSQRPKMRCRSRSSRYNRMYRGYNVWLINWEDKGMVQLYGRACRSPFRLHPIQQLMEIGTT